MFSIMWKFDCLLSINIFSSTKDNHTLPFENPIAQLLMKRVLSKLGLRASQQVAIMSVTKRLAGSPAEAQDVIDKLCASGLVAKESISDSIEVRSSTSAMSEGTFPLQKDKLGAVKNRIETAHGTTSEGLLQAQRQTKNAKDKAKGTGAARGVGGKASVKVQNPLFREKKRTG